MSEGRGVDILRKTLIGVVVLFLISLTQSAQASQIAGVEWYQIQDGKEVRTDFVTPNVPYKVVLTLYSDSAETVHVEVRADLINWFDQVIASKDAVLKPGENRVEIFFVYRHKSWSDDGANPYSGVRGIYVSVSGVSMGVEQRFATRAEVGLTGYYWVALRMYVNGKEYDPDEYAPVESGDTVKMNGYLYRDGRPVPNFKIRWIPLIGSSSYSYTDSRGYFEKTTTAWDWERYDMCGERARYYAIQAIDESGDVVTSWEYTCTCVCPMPAAWVSVESVAGYASVAALVGASLALLARRV